MPVAPKALAKALYAVTGPGHFLLVVTAPTAVNILSVAENTVRSDDGRIVGSLRGLDELVSRI